MKKKISVENTLAIYDICSEVIKHGFNPMIVASVPGGAMKTPTLSGIMTAIEDHFPKFNIFFQDANGSKAKISFDIETDSLIMASFDKKLMPGQFKEPRSNIKKDVFKNRETWK